MIDTRLILIEGLPGMGKSTTSAFVADRIQHEGLQASWFHEFSPDNPIALAVLAGFEGTQDWALPDRSLLQWHVLRQQLLCGSTSTILEGRFWQNRAAFMFLAGVPAEQIIAADQRVYDSIATINPVLIHLVPDDPQRHLKWVFQERCLAPGARPPKMWTDWFVETFATSVLGKSKQWQGFDGVVEGCTQWLQICEQMFVHFPGPKPAVRDPHADWDRTYRAIEELLRILPAKE